MSTVMEVTVVIKDDDRAVWRRTVSAPRGAFDRGAQAQDLAVEASVENGVGGAQVKP